MARLGLKRSRYTVQLPRTPAQSPDTRRPGHCTVKRQRVSLQRSVAVGWKGRVCYIYNIVL